MAELVVTNCVLPLSLRVDGTLIPRPGDTVTNSSLLDILLGRTPKVEGTITSGIHEFSFCDGNGRVVSADWDIQDNVFVDMSLVDFEACTYNEVYPLELISSGPVSYLGNVASGVVTENLVKICAVGLLLLVVILLVVRTLAVK